MADEMMLMLNDDGVAHIYDETYDIVIHCESAEKQKEVEKRLMEMSWVPCKTRLPEDLEEVNVTWVNHRPEPYYEFIKDKPLTASAVYYKGDWYWYSSTCADILAEYGKNDIDKIDDAIEITAWKPIGEPWKENSHD